MVFIVYSLQKKQRFIHNTAEIILEYLPHFCIYKEKAMNILLQPVNKIIKPLKNFKNHIRDGEKELFKNMLKTGLISDDIAEKASFDYEQNEMKDSMEWFSFLSSAS